MLAHFKSNFFDFPKVFYIICLATYLLNLLHAYEVISYHHRCISHHLHHQTNYTYKNTMWLKVCSVKICSLLSYFIFYVNKKKKEKLFLLSCFFFYLRNEEIYEDKRAIIFLFLRDNFIILNTLSFKTFMIIVWLFSNIFFLF